MRPTAHPAERKQTRVNLAGRRVKPATHWPQSALHIRTSPAAQLSAVLAPGATDSDGTCDRRLAHTWPSSAGQRSDFRQNVPGKLALGTGATSECSNSRNGRATGPGRPKTLQHHPHVPTRPQQRNTLRADSTGTRTPHRKSAPPQIAGTFYLCTRTSYIGAGHQPTPNSRPYSPRRHSFVPFPHPSFAGVHST